MYLLNTCEIILVLFAVFIVRGVIALNKHQCDFNLCRHCKCRCDSSDGFVVCDQCHRLFRGRECYEKHLKTNESPMYPKRKVCESVMGCRYCWKDLAASEGVFKRDAEGSCIN